MYHKVLVGAEFACACTGDVPYEDRCMFSMVGVVLFVAIGPRPGVAVSGHGGPPALFLFVSRGTVWV